MAWPAAASLAMVHISRLSEELVLWSSQNFDFIEIADRFTTGSSIMPQKKNPDVPELARGKTGRVAGHLMGLLMLMKGQPLAYNKDNQEDKEPLFDTVDTLKDTLRIFAEMAEGITVQPQAMEQAALKGYATATDLADYLVKKGLPFRDAHETVAHAVKAAVSHNCDLSELPLAVLQQFNPSIQKDVYDALSLRGSLNARNTLGGTAPAQVRAQLERHLAGEAERPCRLPLQERHPVRGVLLEIDPVAGIAAMDDASDESTVDDVTGRRDGAIERPGAEPHTH